MSLEAVGCFTDSDKGTCFVEYSFAGFGRLVASFIGVTAETFDVRTGFVTEAAFCE